MSQNLYVPPPTTRLHVTLRTIIAQSDGSNCPHGWYFLVWGEGVLDDKPSAWGPFHNAVQAVKARDKFLATLNISEPLFSRDPGFLSRTGMLP